MADIEEITLNGKPLSKLRVVDLKQELDQRGLSKAGSKVELMERLRAQMVLEKRHSEAHAASSGDEAKAPNLALQDDAVTGQNDFIKQYLLQQQRSLERQMEIKKKVEEELKRQSADESTDESQDSTGEEEVTPIVMTSKSEVKVVQDAPAGGSSDTEMAKNRRSRQHSKEEKSDASKKESNKATNEKGDADSTEPVVKKSRRQKSPEESEMRRHHRSGSSSRSRSNTPDKDRHFGKGKKVGHRHRHDRGSSSHSPSPKPRDREDSKHVSKRNRSSRNSHSKSKSPEPRRSNRRSTVHSTKATKSLHQVTENPDAEELRDVAFDSKEEKLVTDKETEISSHHKSPKRREDLANRSPRKSPGCSRQFNEKDDKLNENSSNKSAIVEIELPAGESPRKSPSLSSEQAEKKETDEVEKLVRKSKTDLEEFTSLNTATPRVSRWHQESTEKETEPQNRIKSPASLEEKKKEDSCKQSDDSPEHRETTQTDANLEKKIEMVEKTSSKSEDIQHPEVGDSHSIEKEGKNTKSFRKEKENIDVQFEIQEKISDKPSSAQEEPQKVSLPKRSWRSKSKEDVATSKKQKIEDLPKEQVIEKPSEGAAIAGEKEHTSEISKDLNEVDKVTSQKSQKSERRKSFETCTMTKQGQVDPSIFEIQAVSVITSEQESESKKSCLTLPEVPQQEQEMNVSQKEEIDSRNPPKRKNQEGLKDSSYIKKRSSKEHLVELHDSKIKTKSHSRSSSGSQSPVANERTGRQRKREKKSSSSSQSHSENKTTSSSSSRSRSRSGSKSFSSGLEEETSKTLKGKVHTIQRKKERSSSPSARKKNEAEKMHIDEAPEEKKSIEAKEREYFKQRQPGSPSKVSARSSEKEAEKASGKNDGEKDETRNVRSLRLGSTQKAASADDVSKSEGNTEEHIVSLKEKPARRRKWGSSQSKSTASKQRTSTLEISTDSLKGLIEEVHLPTEPVLELEAGETMFLEQDDHDKRDVKVKRTVIMREGEENIENVRRVETSDNPHTSQNTSKEEKEKAPVSKKVKVEKHTPDKKKGVKKEQPSVEQKKTSEPIIAVRRVSQPLVAPDEPETSSRTLSPPRRPVSCVVHVMNLVRPFTVSQLKQLLGRTGKLIESGFWINSIKSHCYVTYEKEDDAVKTREALHGARWPQSNPKLLRVDFASAEEIERHRTEEEGGPAPPRPQPAPQPRAPSPPPVKEKRPAPEPEKKRDERPVREWDRGKRSRSLERGPVVRTRSRSRDRARDKERERERERRHREQERVKEKKEKKSEMPKVEEEPPAKLLDDLFRKTKATPCIYWLPLTDEQYQQRFQQRTRERLERAAEREKRRELEDAEEEAARKKAVEMRRRDGPNSPARDRPEKEGPRLRDSDNSRSRDRDRDRERLARERNRDEDRDRRKPVRSDSRDRNIRQERSASGSRDRRRR